MSDRPRIGLDNSAFRGRLRQPVARVAPLASGPIRQPFGPRVSSRATQAPENKVQLVTQPVASVTSHIAPKYRPDVIAVKSVALPQASHSVHEGNNFKMIAPQPYAVPANPKQQQSKVLHRQAVSNPSAQPKKIPGGHSKLQYALVGMALFVFGIGLFASLITLQTNRAAKSQVAALTNRAQQNDTASTGAATPNTPPSETKPTTASMGTYKVAPDLPQQIIIPKLYVYARIRALSVNANNELQAPANIFDAGWYNASAKPGSGPGSGAMLIDGHVHGPTQPAVFANIKKLVAGDSIQIIRGDGKKFSYSVVKTQNVDAANLDIGSSLTSAVPGKSALNLITCGGRYDKKTSQYLERTIVYAVISDS